MQQSNFSRLKVCARLPRDASADHVLASTTAVAGGASIVIESSLVANAHAPVVRFDEIPVAFEMRGSWTVDAKRQRIVALNTSIDLDGPALSLAGAAPENRGKLKYKVDASDWSGGAVGTEVLPEQLWPFMPGRLVSSHAPTKGVWRAGATVWAATGPASTHNSTHPLGWVCDQGGDPGEWRSFSAMKNDDDHAVEAPMATAQAVFFVAPDGSDTATGTKAAPFRTLLHAQAMTRRLPLATGTRATVYLRAGVFSGPKNVPLEFTEADRGTSWEAFQDEIVLVSGGVMVPESAFTPHPTLPGVTQANLTALGVSHSTLGQVGGNESTGTKLDQSGRYGDVGAFAELFYRGQPAQLAGWPNRLASDIVNYSTTLGGYGPGCLDTKTSCSGNCTGFLMSKQKLSLSRLQRWQAEAAGRDPWLAGFFTWDFAHQFVKLASVDAAGGGLLVDVGSSTGDSSMQTVCKRGARITAVNLLSELDTEMEYYIERSNRSAAAAAARGMLYFRAPQGAVRDSDAVQGAFVSVAASVISFASNASFVTLKGLRLEHSRGSAVVAYGAVKHITISSCTISNTGTAGIEMVDCTNCLIEDCEIYGTAGFGINIAGGRHNTLRRGDNRIQGNDIHHYARWHRSNKPGIHWQGTGNTFAQNRIHDSPTQGIMGGGNTAVCGRCHFDHKFNLLCDNRYDLACGANDNTFDGNWLYNGTRECTDCGQFYSCGQTGTGYTRRGNVFRNNVMENGRRVTHTVNPGAFGNMQVFTFYLDDTMSAWSILNNSFVDSDIGILFNGGRDHTVRGNTFTRVHNAVQLVDECPHGKITVANLYRGYSELQKTMHWPAWDKYNLRDYQEPSGSPTRLNFSNMSFYPSSDAGTFFNWSCSGGGSHFSDNTFCDMSGPFCRGYDVHHCTNTSSVFENNIEKCKATPLRTDDTVTATPPLVLSELLALMTSLPVGGVPSFSLASQQTTDNATLVYFAPSWGQHNSAGGGAPADVPTHIHVARSTDNGLHWALDGRQVTAPPLPHNAGIYLMPLITSLPDEKQLLLFNFFPASPSVGVGVWNGTAFDWPTNASALVPVYDKPNVEDGITHAVILLKSGRLVHVGDYGTGVTAAFSDTGGASWTTGGLSKCQRYQFGCGGEPSAVEMGNGSIWVLTRRNMVDSSPDEGESVLWQSWSDDGGVSFRGGKQVPSAFISYGAPAMLLRLRHNLTRLEPYVGQAVSSDEVAPIVVLYNNGRQLSRFDGGTPENARSLLHATISLDGGKTWRGHREVLRDPLLKLRAGISGERDHGVSYSQAVEQRDGSILIGAGQMAGHWGMARLDPLWLLETKQAVDFSTLSDGLVGTSDFSGSYVGSCAFQSLGGFMPRGRVIYCDTCFSAECPHWNTSNPACMRQQNFQVLSVAFQPAAGLAVYNIGGEHWTQKDGSHCGCDTGCCGLPWLSFCGATVIVTKEEFRSYVNGGNLTCDSFRQMSGARAGIDVTATNCSNYDGVHLRSYTPTAVTPASTAAPQRAMCVALTNTTSQATAQWNFPSAASGKLQMRLALQPNFSGALISLSDHYAPPWDMRASPSVSLYAIKIGPDGRIQMINGSVSTPLPKLQTSGSWHDLDLEWDVLMGLVKLTVDANATTGFVPAIMRHSNQGSANYWALQSLGPRGVCVASLYSSRSAKTDDIVTPPKTGHSFPRLANCWGAGEVQVSAEQWAYQGFMNVTNETWADYDLQYINPSSDWEADKIPDWVETIRAVKRINPSSIVVGTFHTTEVWYKDMIRNGSGQQYLPLDCVIRNADGTPCDCETPHPLHLPAPHFHPRTCVAD
jgi:parallel beta-helix repeat protein